MDEVQELTIDSLAAGGDGVGRDASGRVVFVPRAAPGDRLRVRITKARARYARGVIDEVLSPGPGRRNARCVVFGRCGGCAWQHLNYDVQAEAKQRIVRDALERIAGLSAAAAACLEWIPSPTPFAYRSRARVYATRQGVGFRGAQSHEIIEVDHCPVLVPELDEALAALSKRRGAGSPSESVGEWELASDADGNARVTPLDATPSARVIAVGEERLAASSGVFTQAHAELGAEWTHFVVSEAGGGTRALELFAGVGTLSVPLARAFDSLLAVESERRAAAHLRTNLKRIPGRGRALRARVTPGGLASWLCEHEPEVVVLDPPRSGLGAAASRELCAPTLRRIVYAACDPAPWARDLSVLREGGFQIARTAAFDFFPQTAHIEVVATLERS